ncbi:MAG: hypothetical protein A3K10_02840 [Bacteroidetes bacterium RIFCSPLOWO2_12_FULL_31_6]|nr:MAG: hypothetical protein A3K10_02840 [Bacteroidetes bacterium RIFCSPLOWO2_12_FULL_31_6]
MKPSDELHQLIKNLSMSEKRYFKIFSSRHVIAGENNYIRLFDAIEKQEEYNEQKIKATFSKETFISHLPSEKHYLYNHVLDSLNAFHKDRTFLTRYCNIIMTIEILYHKGLFDQCKKLIKKAKVEAYSLEKFTILKIIVRWEILVYIKDEDVKSLNKSFDEELRILEVIRIQSALMRIAFKIQIEMYRGKVSSSFLREREKELKQHYPPKKEVNSFWARYYFHSSMGLIYSVENKAAQRLVCYKEINLLLENTKQFIVDLPHIYQSNNNNLVNLMFAMTKYDEVMPMLEKQRSFMQTYKIKNATLSKMVFIHTHESELFLLYKLGQTEEGASIIKKIEPELKKMSLLFSPALFDLFFMMAVISFCEGDYRSAIKWLNKILNTEREMNIRIELRINARLLYLIVLFEKEDLFFDNQYQSTKRFLTQEKKHQGMMKILEAIRLVSDGKQTTQKEEKLKHLHKKIKAERNKAQADTIDKQFDFVEWIESRIKI